MNDSTIEEDFGGVGNLIEDSKGFLKVLVVVVIEGKHPRLNFLTWYVCQLEKPSLMANSRREVI